MTRQLLVRQGGGSATEVDFLDLATPRKGSPFFDRDAPLLQMGQRFANGEAAQGYFKIVDPAAALSTTGFRTRPWAEVRLVDDASGDELTLAWMRVTANDASRRAPYTGGDQVEHDPQLMDCNLDLRGIPFEAGWHRDAETEGNRLNALEGVKLNGASSTADIHRDTTNVTIASIGDGHLCDFSDSTDLDTVNYPAGIEVAEIIADIAEQSGKIWGVVLHHTGGSTHKCLLYVGQDDLTTYTTDVRISDQLADHAPDDPDAPTFEPHWLMGAGREQNMEGVISGLVSIYGGIDGEERTVFVETGEDPDEWETWVGVFNDDQADTLTVAERHANWQLADRKRPYQTHKVSILVNADQAHLVEAGMAIETKSVVMEPGPNKHNWIWRRVAEKTIEPAADGRYWLHLHLERPRHTHGARGGGGQPGSTSPKPAPAPVPDVPGAAIATWDFESHGFADEEDTTGTYDSGLVVTTGSRCPGAGHCGWTTASHRASAALPVSASTEYTFEFDVRWHFTPTNRNIYVKFNGAGGSEVGLADEFYLVKGAGHANNTTYHVSTTVTAPVGATTMAIWYSPFAGIMVDNMVWGTAGTVTEDDPDALPDGGDSPYYARSDDPRFDADNQHLTSRVSQRVTNNSGVTLEPGAVVVPDTSIDGPAVTRTTTASSTAGPIGVIVEGGADDDEVVVLWSGAVVLVETNGTPADGDYLFTSTTAGVADRSATRATGAFGRIVRDDGAGETLSCLIWGVPDGAGSAGAVATDAIWDAKGDLAAGTGANTAAKLTAGADDTILMADSGQSTGLKWVPSATPSTQAFGDAAATGTADTFTRGDHKHAMPTDPVTAHAAASDPHTGYVLESLIDAKGDIIAGTAADTVGRLAVGSNGKVLTAASGETTGLKWASGSDISISVGGNLGDIPPVTPGTYDEEFNGTADTLPAGTWDTTPSGSDIFTLNSRWPSLLTVEGTGAATYQWTRTGFTAGATFGIWAKFYMGSWQSADNPQLRIYVTDSTDGERRGIELRVTGTRSATFRGLKRTGAGAENVWDTATAVAHPLTSFYVGITRTSNSWVGWVSQDGVAWIKQCAAESQTFTVDRFRMLFKTSSDGSVLGVDWIRYRTDTGFPRM